MSDYNPTGGTAVGGTGDLDKQGEAGGCRDAHDKKDGKK